MNLIDYVKGRKAQDATWNEIAKEITLSDPEDFEGEYRVFESGDILRKWYRRKNEKYTITIPQSVPQPFEDILEVPIGVSLILADLHAPYHAETFIKEAVERALESVYSLDQIIIAGDTFDFAGLSQYSKAHNVARLETELQIGGSLLLYLAQYAPVYVTMGNHENRFADKLDMAFSLNRLVNTALNGRQPVHAITTTDRDYLFLGESYIIGHLSSGGAIAGKNAHNIAQKYKRHCLAGHDHIRGVFNPSSRYIGASIGCCADVKKFWYSERLMNSMRFMERGYAIVTDETSFDLIGEDHEPYFVKTHFNNSTYHCIKI
jgi:hypothetical protein